MRREDLSELHYITPISTVPSILANGILSNKRAQKHPHASVALAEVQDRRDRVVVPQGRPLHEYANLYFHARNPMMYKRKPDHQGLCVLRVNPDVLDLPHVVVTDRNAAKDFARFYPARKGLEKLDRDQVFADDWRHPGDLLAYVQHRGIKCAEILVPDRVDTAYIVGAYVSCDESRRTLLGLTKELRTEVNPHLFFL